MDWGRGITQSLIDIPKIKKVVYFSPQRGIFKNPIRSPVVTAAKFLNFEPCSDKCSPIRPSSSAVKDEVAFVPNI